MIYFLVASLLSCLHQLRAENIRLEEHVSTLLQRRDHLMAVNARLAIPLSNPPLASQPLPNVSNTASAGPVSSEYRPMASMASTQPSQSAPVRRYYTFLIKIKTSYRIY